MDRKATPETGVRRRAGAVGRGDVREAVAQALDESAFHAKQGVRPPALVVAPPQVGRAAARFSQAARHEMLMFDDPSGCLDQGVPERKLVHVANCMRGAAAQVPAVRQITSREGLLRDAPLGTIAWRQGAHARLIPRIPFRLSVIDRTVALLPLDLDVFYNGMLVVRDPVVVTALVRVHQGWWRNGDDPDGNRPDHELPPYLAPVLACLTEGLTDPAAAARTGLSPRTYARRVSELLTLLGATTRFQAGALAARRGWM
ncbi:DNA-binding response regulator [Yinghuangia sp. YIM S09857]|uniref:helix-turn-helix transcriptional regulator n=1 Tax=Yinghuangia sp. YIM S09857 TaxID=3436929 RepID=UPI003F532D19